MDPTRAAALLRNIGLSLLFLALALRAFSIPITDEALAQAVDAAASNAGASNGGAVPTPSTPEASTAEESGAPEESPALQPQLVTGENRAEVLPVLGRYTITDSGQAVLFQVGLAQDRPPYALVRSGWYRVPAAGGAVTPAEEPAGNLRPFIQRGERLFLLNAGDETQALEWPAGARVLRTALSPDRQAVAFAAAQPTNGVGLFVLYSDGRLDWLGDEEQIAGLAWSPDGAQIAYTALREGDSQVFAVSRGGGEHRQLTGDAYAKSSLTWTADGAAVAYRAEVPTPYRPNEIQNLRGFTSDLFLVAAQGGTPVRLTDTPEEEILLGRIGDGELAYAAHSLQEDDVPQVEVLRALNPASGSQRQVYPSLAIEELACPPSMPRGKSYPLPIALANGALLPTSATLVLSSDSQLLPISDERQAGADRVETIDLPAQGQEQLEWPVYPAPGLFTYITVLIDQGEQFPIAYRACAVRNTYFGLPNLAFLPLLIPLIVLGMLLIIPWLRHQKKRWLWLAWAATPLLFIALVWYEVSLV